tara:strand:- start:309 stop:824 length:516 start_codon:yes stop_codon:yes gene_type:complete
MGYIEQDTATFELRFVNEAIGNYFSNFESTSKRKVNQKQVTYNDFLSNKMLIIRAIRQGLPYEIFNFIKDITPFTEDDWADYLNLSKKTLLRYRNEEDFLFKPIHSEKIIELAEVTNYGKTVFDTTEQFYLWLNTPSYALGNLMPGELLKDSYGKELVMSELNRIENGIFA